MVVSTLALIFAALIGAAGSVSSSAISSGTQAKVDYDKMAHESQENQLDRENEFNLKQMEINQENYLASNKHQLEVEDLKAAGLNPALSSGGISTGSSAVGSTSGSSSMTSKINQFSSNAIQPLMMSIVGSGIKNVGDTKRIFNQVQRQVRSSAFESLDSMHDRLNSQF